MPISSTLLSVPGAMLNPQSRGPVEEQPFQLESLSATIRDGRAGDDLDVAIDALVGLTVRTDDVGFNARECLRDVFRDAATSPDTRVKLLNACNGMCGIFLDAHVQGVELSPTVLHLGWHAPEPPQGSSGGALRTKIDQELSRQLGGKTLADVLASVEGAENRDNTDAQGALVLVKQAFQLEITCGGWRAIDGHVVEAGDDAAGLQKHEIQVGLAEDGRQWVIEEPAAADNTGNAPAADGQRAENSGPVGVELSVARPAAPSELDTNAQATRNELAKLDELVREINGKCEKPRNPAKDPDGQRRYELSHMTSTFERLATSKSKLFGNTPPGHRLASLQHKMQDFGGPAAVAQIFTRLTLLGKEVRAQLAKLENGDGNMGALHGAMKELQKEYRKLLSIDAVVEELTSNPISIRHWTARKDAKKFVGALRTARKLADAQPVSSLIQLASSLRASTVGAARAQFESAIPRTAEILAAATVRNNDAQTAASDAEEAARLARFAADASPLVLARADELQQVAEQARAAANKTQRDAATAERSAKAAISDLEKFEREELADLASAAANR